MRTKLIDIYPGSKMAMLLSFILAGLVINQTSSYLAIISLFILLSAAYGILKDYFMSLLKIIVLLTVIMFLMIVLTTSGEALAYQIGFIKIYQEGLLKAGLMISRIVLVCSGILLLYKINTVEEIAMVLETMGIPTLGVFVIQSTMTMIPHVKEKLSTIMEAQASRGMDFSGNLFQRTKKIIPLLFPLVLSSFYDTEEKTLVLVARGIECKGKKCRLYNKQRKKSDNLFIIASLFVVMLAFYWRVNNV